MAEWDYCYLFHTHVGLCTLLTCQLCRWDPGQVSYCLEIYCILYIYVIYLLLQFVKSTFKEMQKAIVFFLFYLHVSCA